MRILVVDDIADTRETFAELLVLDGHQVWLAADAEDAIAHAIRARPDAALIDIGLPGRVNGYGVAAELRRLLPHAMLVAISGWPKGTHPAEERWFDEYLIKPVDVDALSSELSRRDRVITAKPVALTSQSTLLGLLSEWLTAHRRALALELTLNSAALGGPGTDLRSVTPADIHEARRFRAIATDLFRVTMDEMTKQALARRKA